MIKELIKNAEHHKELSESIVERVRSGKHAYIHRRTNLMYVMKNDFLKTNRCDFAIGKKLLRTICNRLFVSLTLNHNF